MEEKRLRSTDFYYFLADKLLDVDIKHFSVIPHFNLFPLSPQLVKCIEFMFLDFFFQI